MMNKTEEDKINEFVCIYLGIVFATIFWLVIFECATGLVLEGIRF